MSDGEITKGPAERPWDTTQNDALKCKALLHEIADKTPSANVFFGFGRISTQGMLDVLSHLSLACVNEVQILDFQERG